MSPTVATPLFSILSESEILRDYRAAFEAATGLPLSFQSPGAPAHFERLNPLCALLAKSSAACGSCCELRQKLESSAHDAPRTLRCLAGLCETAVPVRVGERLVAYLETGRVLLEVPSSRRFKRIARDVLKLDPRIDPHLLEEAYFASRVLGREQYEAMIRLLDIFAHHLAACGGLLALRHSTPEQKSPAIAAARRILETESVEPLTLESVARRVNLSAGYFSQLFREATGLTFVEYVTRLRIEKAKRLLEDPHRRIGEAAHDAGFQSISQFNRAFRRVTGRSPRAYRAGIVARQVPVFT